MTIIRMPPRQSLTTEWHSPETIVPADALPPLSADVEAALLADARELHQADDDRAPYIDGWYWGVVCGACATLAFLAVCVAAGYAVGLIF